ncbi:hypothetical protein M011DRAFT_129576 [Sporormia fimetaria CBS 119925]|uniref:Uncharacterized protein n=1 Tax=Sporormia fimetaria CBS 119925 TaxID=1340428 RepID=A0A6A6V8G8_9PLEO|nr:hypothetical protein M011DRAFT_129576 [Sporormia fimetaria CBS 119925]
MRRYGHFVSSRWCCTSAFARGYDGDCWLAGCLSVGVPLSPSAAATCLRRKGLEPRSSLSVPQYQAAGKARSDQSSPAFPVQAHGDAARTKPATLESTSEEPSVCAAKSLAQTAKRIYKEAEASGAAYRSRTKVV